MEEKTASRPSRIATRSSKFGGRKSTDKLNMSNTRRRAVPSYLRQQLRETMGKISSIFIYMPNSEPYVTHRATTITSGGRKIGTMIEVEYQAKERDVTEGVEENTAVEPSPKRKKRLDELDRKVEMKEEPEEETTKMEQKMNKNEDNDKTAEFIQSVSSSVDSSQQPRRHTKSSNPVWANSRRRGNATIHPGRSDPNLGIPQWRGEHIMHPIP